MLVVILSIENQEKTLLAFYILMELVTPWAPVGADTYVVKVGI